MNKVNYTDLKNRVDAFYLRPNPDDRGGYREVWMKAFPLWAAVLYTKELSKPCADIAAGHHERSPCLYKFIIRAREDYEDIKGFGWKKKIWRTLQDPYLSPCRRFVVYKTLSPLKNTSHALS